VIASYRWTDCVFGRAGPAVLLRQAAPTRQAARRLQPPRGTLAQAHGLPPPTRRRLYTACVYAAGAWGQPGRVVLTAAVMTAGDTPRFVVPSREAPTPQMVYEARYCARGTCANAIQAVQGDRRSARTSATPFLANALRLFLACAASALPHAWRPPPLQHTALAPAPPAPVILPRCKIATPVKQDKARLLLPRPSAWPGPALLQRVPTLLYVVPALTCHTA
jgi:hypothetical protein